MTLITVGSKDNKINRQHKSAQLSISTVHSVSFRSNSYPCLSTSKWPFFSFFFFPPSSAQTTASPLLQRIQIHHLKKMRNKRLSERIHSYLRSRIREFMDRMMRSRGGDAEIAFVDGKRRSRFPFQIEIGWWFIVILLVIGNKGGLGGLKSDGRRRREEGDRVTNPSCFHGSSSSYYSWRRSLLLVFPGRPRYFIADPSEATCRNVDTSAVCSGLRRIQASHK